MATTLRGSGEDSHWDQRAEIRRAPKQAAYDPAAADAFYRARPFTALGRALQLGRRSGGFVVSLLLDKLLKREDRMIEQRSQELLDVVTKLGPTFIKVDSARSVNRRGVGRQVSKSAV